MDRLLASLYYSPERATFMTNTSHLYRAAKKHNKRVTLAAVRAFLNAQRVYTTHRQQRAPRRRMATTGTAHSSHLLADLADLQRLARWNGGKAYILVVVDATSRLIRAVPLKTKSAEEVTPALVDVVKSYPGVVDAISTDSG